jgi:hypothetical protein
MISFSELWEKCEGLHKEESTSVITDELLMKVKLYKAFEDKEIPHDELQKVKSRTMGEILLTLTNLSVKDNINVYEALSIAMQYKKIS